LRNHKIFFAYVNQNITGITSFFVPKETVEDNIALFQLDQRYSEAKKVAHIRQIHRMQMDHEARKLILFETAYDTEPAGVIQLQSTDKKSEVDDIDEGDWVAAVYDTSWYFGRVVSTNPREEELEVLFLKQNGGQHVYKLTTFENSSILIPYGRVLMKLAMPETNRSGRTFTFSKEVVSAIEARFVVFSSII